MDRTFRSSKGLVVTSHLTDVEAAKTCAGIDRDFAQGLARKFEQFGQLSEGQLAWLHKMALDRLRPRPVAEEVGDIAPIRALFDVARQHVKYPKVRLMSFGAGPVVLGVAGDRSKYPGSINVTDGGPFASNKWFGRIQLDGTFQQGRASTEAVVELLKKFAADPAGVASEQGRLSGYCCFCSRPLTDERSLAVGYGLTCAGHFGLPWGEERFGMADAVREAS